MDTENYSPNKPETWHNRFSKEELQWQDLARISKVFVPVLLLLFIPLLYSYFLIILGNTPKLSEYQHLYQRIWLALSVIVPLILPFIISIFVFTRIVRAQATKIIRDFHSPPSDYNLSGLLKRRLFGVPPVPAPLNLIFNYPFITLKEAQDLPKDHWARWYGGPATLVIYDGVAVYVERGNKFSRVLGPGLPMPVLERYERIKAVVDLRPQIRDKKITAWTKDGVEVEFNVRAEFQIASSDEAKRQSVKLEKEGGKTHLIYPFDAEQVKIMVERTAVHFNQRTKILSESTWESTAMGSITGSIRQYISSQSTDELLLEEENSPQVSSLVIDEKLRSSIEVGLKKAGTKLISLQITDITPVDEEIFQGLQEYWDAQKEKEKALRKGEAEAESIRAKQSAQTEAYQELLTSITENLASINRGAGGPNTERFTEASILLLTQSLEKNLGDPLLGSFVARHGLRTLEILKKQLNI